MEQETKPAPLTLPEPYYHDEDAGITIYCADCRDILPLLDPVDMVFTDPPYGHNNNNNGDLISRWEAALGRGDYIPERDNRPIANDGIEANELFEQFIIIAKDKLKQSGSCCCCCCGGGGPDPMFARWSLILDKYLTFKQMVVWDKGPMGMGWHYRRSYETILVAHKGQTCNWYDETNKIENIIRPNKNYAPKIIPSKEQHPTEKPVGLATHFIKLHSKDGDTILDPFMGSGTTLVAALQLGRKAIGIGIELKYCEIAVRRLQQGVLNFSTQLDSKEALSHEKPSPSLDDKNHTGQLDLLDNEHRRGVENI
jgi:site-specific DNA-methyltransferase (adenine-specific)